MEDDDDNDSVVLEGRSSENIIGNRISIMKSSKDIGSSSRRDRRRNRRYVKIIFPFKNSLNLPNEMISYRVNKNVF